MDTRKFLLILTVVIAVYVTVSSATQTPANDEHDNKAVQLAEESHSANSDKNGDDVQPTEGKKSKPKRKHHGKKGHRNNHARPRSHGGRNRTRNHHKSHRHGSKDKTRPNKNPSGVAVGTPLPSHEDIPVKTGENMRQQRNHNNKKEKKEKNRNRTREGRNRNHNQNQNTPSTHLDDNIQSDAASINDRDESQQVYQAQNYNHNLVGHSTKTSLKHEPTKATASNN